MVEEYFKGEKFFSELEPKERRKLLFDYLKFISENRNLNKRELIHKYSILNRTTESRIRKLHDLLFFSDIILLKKPWITKKAEKIIERGRLTPSDYADAPKHIVKAIDEPPKEVPIRGKFIGADKSTRYSIYYHPLTKRYFLMDAEGNFKGWLDRINITLTYSLDTSSVRSHQRLVLEAMAWTLVEKKNPEEIEDIIDELDDFLTDAIAYYFNAGVADIAVKQGVEYQSKPEGIVAKYPEMRCLLVYHHGDKKKARKIEKTKTEFELEKSRYPRKEHMDKGGRPPTRLTRFIRR